MFEQPYVWLIFAGLILRAAGFIVRDELMLRVLVFTSTFFDIAFYMLQSPSIWGAVATNSVMVGINFVMIMIIITERSSMFMSAQDRLVFQHFRTLTPGQFRRVNRMAKWRVTEGEEILLREGERSDAVFFINSDAFSVVKQGQRYDARGPAFAGEIMFLQGGVASASVVVPKGAVVARWNAERLRHAMHKNRPLENALIARFGHDLADKVRHSVPVPRRAETEKLTVTPLHRADPA
ncbi:MAG: cyclic nucleotide-binding domain-containing protein [Pseudomonadota bacterium]